MGERERDLDFKNRIGSGIDLNYKSYFMMLNCENNSLMCMYEKSSKIFIEKMLDRKRIKIISNFSNYLVNKVDNKNFFIYKSFNEIDRI